MANARRPRPGTPVVLFLAWLPLAVMLPIAASQMSAEPLEGAWLGLRSALIGAALVALVWRVSGRLSWPERAGLGFYLGHVVAAATFATLWRAATLFAVGIGQSAGPIASIRADFASPLATWDLMLKFMVYGLMTGLSYAVREAEQVQLEREKAARLDALATRAQLSALRAQLNPHFLFNTLHTMSALIGREPALAEEAVDRLGDLLRFTLHHSGTDEIPLREECQFVENYLTLERLRLGTRLQVVMRVDAHALFLGVPPFSVQPLVENAIRHGLAPREEGGTLWICAGVEGSELVVLVRDNGVGADLNAPASSGSGLESLRRRIEARHDGAGRLMVETSPGRGFAVTMRLPLSTADTQTLGLVSVEAG